jgi:hypothetical protein
MVVLVVGVSNLSLSRTDCRRDPMQCYDIYQNSVNYLKETLERFISKHSRAKNSKSDS